MTGVYAILGGSSGAGATTTTAALGASLAEGPLRVGIVDADLGGAELTESIDVAVDGPTIESVLAGQATLLDATYKRSRDFAVVPSASDCDWQRNANLGIAADIVDVARQRYDVVLLDVGVSDRLEAMLWASLADRAVFASTLDEESLTATAEGRQAVEYLGTPVEGVIVTRIDAGVTPDLSAIERHVSTPVLAALPHDESVVASSAAGVPVIEHDPDSPTAETYWELAARIAADDLSADPIVPSSLSNGLDEGTYHSPGATSAAEAGSERASETTQEADQPTAAAAGGTETAADGENGGSNPAFDWVDSDGSAGASGEAADAESGRSGGGKGNSVAGVSADQTGQTAGDDEEDPVAAAFKDRMQNAREQRETERSEEVGEEGLLDKFFS
ncbi:MinD/ParA family ATP-binding protein [Halostella pelagica]|uniref:MinD/ParA family ATP-binding protein n=1 Tax=Halostella pelagica TaxID=2583824 RepID=UPI0013871C1D|nr:MinD/ParA family protein [Halostella pelagica]